MNYATDPDYLNADFIDQIKWLLDKKPEDLVSRLCSMMDARRNNYPETANYSYVFWSTVTFNHNTKDS